VQLTREVWDARRKLADKYPDLVRIDPVADAAPPATWRDMWRYSGVHYDARVAGIQNDITRLDQKLDWIKSIEAKNEKKRQDKARIAALMDRARGGAAAIRENLPRDHPYPYCGGPLGDAPHANHIHPISKGGLSIRQNMVYICASCNNRKGNQTLTAFVAKEEKDLAVILQRLRQLGKDY
jgi:5-methylcytosine-specific restriction endonuclease McrA